MQTERTEWWERRRVLALLVLAAAVPLIWPALPPLADLPGHMGRWHIAMSLPHSPTLARYYAFEWRLIPNLGLDLIVPLVARVLPFELAAKIVVMAIPMLTVTGLLWTAREAHGRVPPTALLALPLAYAWPFQFGFVNFALSQALAFCALGLWLRLGNRLGRRAILFVPIACVLWIAHSFGWGLFGLMAAGAEIARLRQAGRGWIATLAGTAMQCVPLALPALAMLHGSGQPLDYLFDWSAKPWWIVSILRDRWMMLDVASLGVPALALYLAARSPRLGFAALLGWPALLCTLAFLLLPRLLMGGAYVDMRMAPAALMLALIAIRPPEGHARFAHALAWGALLFCGVRTAATTWSFVQRAAEQQRELAAIAAIPRGASVLALVARPCSGVWSDLRRDQLPSMAIVRRDVFTNGQWAIPGQQGLRIVHDRAAPYTTDPSQLVVPKNCRAMGSDFATAIREFSRGAFGYVWTIGFPPGAAKARDLRVVWTNGESALYRVMPTGSATR